ncbi:MAG: hypothetical protein ABIP03_14860 [Aquihabitans sp.]
MNNPEQFNNLDTRAARAAADIHTQANARPRPAFDAERPLSITVPSTALNGSVRPSRRGLLAVAAVVLVVVGAIAVGVNRSDNGRTEDLASHGGQPRAFQANWLPDGFRLQGAGEAGAGVQGRGSSPIAVELYGPNPSQPQVGIAVTSKDGLTPSGPSLGQVDLGNGRTGDWYEMFGAKRRMLGVDFGQYQMMLVASEAGEAELVSIARGVHLEGAAVAVDPEVLPDGWNHLGTEPDLLASLNPLAAVSVEGPLRLSMYGAGYVDGANDASSVVVGSMPGTETRLGAARVLLDGVHEVTIRGHQGVVGHLSGEAGTDYTMRSVAWLEKPGELVRVSAMGLSEAEMIRVAEDVKVIDEAAWKSILLRSNLGDLQNDPKLEIGRGEFADGTAWVVRKSGASGSDPSTELSVATGPLDSSSSSSSGGPEPEFRSIETLDKGGRYFASGLIGDAVATVELRSATGTVLGQATIVEGNGARAWVTELTKDPTVVVALDANGVELDRRTLENLADNVTAGDGVDGSHSFEGQGTPISPDGSSITIPAG